MQFAAPASGITNPNDIKIIETDAAGNSRDPGLTFGENEYIPGDVDDEEEERGGWDNKLDFLFSCISVSVGLGSKSMNFLTYSGLLFYDSVHFNFIKD